MDPTQLLQAIQKGDTAAFSRIVERYQTPLFGFLGRLGVPQRKAEELAQETFLRAWRHLGAFDPARAQFSTWLFTIARHLAFDDWSAYHVEPRDSSELEHLLAQSASEQPGALEAMIAAQQADLLHAALRQLPFADRSALALAYVQELDLASIARIEGCSLAAIKTRLHRAKQKLRLLLENPNG